MGRDAGWIALNAAVAGGAEICLLPEIPYDINKVLEAVEARFYRDRGFAIIVVAEGALPVNGTQFSHKETEVGSAHIRLGGVANKLSYDLKMAGCHYEIRETVLGHIQRGGVPIAYDRVLASQFGVKAFEMVLEGKFGRMVSYRHPHIIDVSLKEAIREPNLVTPETALMKTARGLGIRFGD